MVGVTQPFVGSHTPAGWDDWRRDNVVISEGGAMLASDPLPAYVSPEPAAPAPSDGVELIDLAIDDCNEVYALSRAGEVYRIDREIDRVTRLACTFEDGLDRAVGLAVTGDTIYVAQGASGPDATDGRVQAVAKRLLHHRFTREVGIEDPVALIADGADACVLDAGAGDRAGRLLRLTREATLSEAVSGLVEPRDVAVDRDDDRYVLERSPDDGTGSRIRRFPAPVEHDTDDAGGSVPEGDGSDGSSSDDTVGESAAGGTVVVAADEFEAQAPTERFEPVTIAVDHTDEVIAGAAPGTTDRPLFRRRPSEDRFERLSGFEGAVVAVTIERERTTCEPAALLVLRAGGLGLTRLSARTPHSLDPLTKRYDGSLVERFDSGLKSCEWDRVLLERGDRAAGTRLEVSYFASDDPVQQFEAELGVEAVDGIGHTFGERLRDSGVATLSELVRLDPATLAKYASSSSYTVSQSRTAMWIDEARDRIERSGEAEWRTLDAPDPTDALLDDATGRYLWVKLDLVGGRFSTPVVESFRAYFPRQSYLRHMPALYREDGESAAFLERYLSIFESIFVDLEEQIEASLRYLDPAAIPAEHVPWLEEWLALEVDETWPTGKRRTLLEHAPELFKHRGTRAGLLGTIRLFLEGRLDPPTAWTWALDTERESLKRRRSDGQLPDDVADAALARRERSLFVREHSALTCAETGPARTAYERLVPCPQCFAVVLPPHLADGPIATVERVVDAQQPAHATGRTVQLEPYIQLAGQADDRAGQTYLGVNSGLVDREFVVEEATIGRDAVLREHEPDGQLGLRSRLGTDTRVS